MVHCGSTTSTNKKRIFENNVIILNFASLKNSNLEVYVCDKLLSLLLCDSRRNQYFKDVSFPTFSQKKEELTFSTKNSDFFCSMGIKEIIP